MRDALARIGFLPLQGRRLLEVGAGEGRWFPTFLAFGAEEDGITGVELDEQRVARCNSRFPRADVRVGDASKVPWRDGSFDVVFQSALLSSVLNPSLRRAVAAEMLRVLRPGGAVISYDFAYDNPQNRSVQGITRRELARLFPNCTMVVRRATLAPPLARRIVPLSHTLASVLESVRLLNTHLIATIRPR